MISDVAHIWFCHGYGKGGKEKKVPEMHHEVCGCRGLSVEGFPKSVVRRLEDGPSVLQTPVSVL